MPKPRPKGLRPPTWRASASTPIATSTYGRAEDWGYGSDPADEGAFLARLRGLIAAATRHAHVVGFCYTQLTDVE